MHLIRLTHTPRRFRAQLSYKRTVGKWQTKRLILLPFYRFIRSFSNKIHIFAASVLCDDFGYRTAAAPSLRRSAKYLFGSIHLFVSIWWCDAISIVACVPCASASGVYISTFLLRCRSLSLANIGIFTHSGFTASIKKTRTKERTSAYKTTDAAASILKLVGLRSCDFVWAKEKNNGRNYYRH